MKEQTPLKTIPISFKAMTEEEKDNILKTLIVLVFRTLPQEDFPILKTYAYYGAQAFDNSIKIKENKHTFYFYKSKQKKRKDE